MCSEIINALNKEFNNLCETYSEEDVRAAMYMFVDKLDKKIIKNDKSIIYLKPMNSVHIGLRNIAYDIENNYFKPSDSCTIIYGQEVFHLGKVLSDEQAVCEAIFNMNIGITKITMAGLGHVG